MDLKNKMVIGILAFLSFHWVIAAPNDCESGRVAVIAGKLNGSVKVKAENVVDMADVIRGESHLQVLAPGIGSACAAGMGGTQWVGLGRNLVFVTERASIRISAFGEASPSMDWYPNNVFHFSFDSYLNHKAAESIFGLNRLGLTSFSWNSGSPFTRPLLDNTFGQYSGYSLVGEASNLQHTKTYAIWVTGWNFQFTQ